MRGKIHIVYRNIKISIYFLYSFSLFPGAQHSRWLTAHTADELLSHLTEKWPDWMLISAGVVSKPRVGFRAAKAIGEVDSDNDWIIVMLMMEGR